MQKKVFPIVLALVLAVGYFSVGGRLPFSAGYPTQLNCGVVGTPEYADCKAKNVVYYCKIQKEDAFFGRFCSYENPPDDVDVLSCGNAPTLCPDIVTSVFVCRDDPAGNPACVDAWASAPNSCSVGWGYGSRYKCPGVDVKIDSSCRNAQYAQCDALYASAYPGFLAQSTIQPTSAPTGIPTSSPIASPTFGLPVPSVPSITSVSKEEQPLAVVLVLGILAVVAYLFVVKK